MQSTTLKSEGSDPAKDSGSEEDESGSDEERRLQCLLGDSLHAHVVSSATSYAQSVKRAKEEARMSLIMHRPGIEPGASRINEVIYLEW